MTVEDGLGLSGGAPGGRHWAWLDINEKVKVALDLLLVQVEKVKVALD